MTVAVQPGWAGLELYHQVFVLDAGAPGGALSASNGLRLAYGPDGRTRGACPALSKLTTTCESSGGTG